MRTNSSKILIAVSVILILTVFSAFPVFAQGVGQYIILKPGIYSPQDDLEDFDTGFNGELAFGAQFNKYLAVEMGVGYFHTGLDESAAGNISGINYAVEGEFDIDVLPVTLSLKGILPVGKWEFYGFGGIGGYFVWGQLDVTAAADGIAGSVSLEDNDVIFGGHLGLGVDYNITPAIFIGAEGKYLWTSEAKLEDTVSGIPVGAKFNLDGIIATAVLGFRF